MGGSGTVISLWFSGLGLAQGQWSPDSCFVVFFSLGPDNLINMYESLFFFSIPPAFYYYLPSARSLSAFSFCLSLGCVRCVSSLFLTLYWRACKAGQEEEEEGLRMCSGTSKFLLGSLQYGFKAFLPLTALPAWLCAQTVKVTLSLAGPLLRVGLLPTLSHPLFRLRLCAFLCFVPFEFPAIFNC